MKRIAYRPGIEDDLREVVGWCGAEEPDEGNYLCADLQTAIAERLGEYADDGEDYPAMLVMTGYHRPAVRLGSAESWAELICERLDDEHKPDCEEWTEPTPAMVRAMSKCLKVFRGQYVVRSAEPCAEVAVNVAAYLKEDDGD